jgi:hypothetical protein
MPPRFHQQFNFGVGKILTRSNFVVIWADEVLTFRFSVFGVALTKCTYIDESGT